MGIKSFLSKLFGASEAEPVQEGAKPCCCGAKEGHGAAKTKAPAPKASPAEQKANLRDLEGFVEYVVKALVDYPDEVVVSSDPKDDSTLIKIVCRPGDRGKIIGKKGKTIMALRSLVSGAAGRLQNRVMVEVLDDDEVKG